MTCIVLGKQFQSQKSYHFRRSYLVALDRRCPVHQLLQRPSVAIGNGRVSAEVRAIVYFSQLEEKRGMISKLCE